MKDKVLSNLTAFFTYMCCHVPGRRGLKKRSVPYPATKTPKQLKDEYLCELKG